MADAQIYPMQSNGAPHVHEAAKGKANSRKNTPDKDIVPEVDDDLENGPIFKRHCTDIL
jgi:hypothetical protein